MMIRTKRVLQAVGAAAIVSLMSCVPAFADEVSVSDWNSLAVADVRSSANIRSEATTQSSRVGSLPRGGVAEVQERGEGWTLVTSGEVTGYIRNDLLAFGEEARSIYTSIHGTDMAADAKQDSAETASISGSDLDLLAAIIQCEAGGESHEGKVAVGAVIMNRIRSSQFPNTVSEVVYQSGQFTPVSSGTLSGVLSQGAREDCYVAAREALAGANPVGDSLYFNSGTGRGIQIGNQHFY